MKNVVSIDVEQWSNRPILKPYLKEEYIDSNIIYASVKCILDIFKKYDKCTTFFVLGEVAERAPELIEEIIDGGHEIAFHGYSHLDLFHLGRNGFEKELRDWESVIYPITRERIRGFRSPVFSLSKETVWALNVLRKNGYRYDSSVFPVKTPLYGSDNAPTHPYFPSFENPFSEDKNQNELLELPLLIRDLGFRRIPAGGGFYLRLLGAKFILNSMKLLNKQGHPAMCYFHPWEIFGFPKIDMPFHKKIFSYYGVPCLKGFERLVKNTIITPACEIIGQYGVGDS